MSIRSVARRLAVTLPFFTLAAVVLGFLSNPTAPDSPFVDSPSSSLILIVTTESLDPAFRALGVWNQVQGCPSDIVSIEPETDRGAIVSYLATLCRKRGATGVLLGGNTELVPLLLGHGRNLPPAAPVEEPRILPVPTPRTGPLPRGMTFGRAPVGDLAEAWAFVEACRTSGRTLEQLMHASASQSVAALLGDTALPVSRSLRNPLPAQPIH